MKARKINAGLFAAALVIAGQQVQAQSPFATAVVEYRPAPGQFVQEAQFSDPGRALGAPVGGGVVVPDNIKLVTLGAFGGSITLAFDHMVEHSRFNPYGVDFIVFGNASWVAGNPQNRFAEPAHVEVSHDANGNGVADDPWYPLNASYGGPLECRTWDSDFADPVHPPADPSWWPAGAPPQFTTCAYRLPTGLIVGFSLPNPDPSDDEAIEGFWGFADCSPTMRLGDLDADGAVDDPMITPEEFYTRPDDPRVVGVTPGCGGGDGFNIALAIDPDTGRSVELPGIHFIRITTAIDRDLGSLGELSAEIGGASDVRPVITGDWNQADGVNSSDFFAFLNDFFVGDADVNQDGLTDSSDFFAFLGLFFAGGGG